MKMSSRWDEMRAILSVDHFKWHLQTKMLVPFPKLFPQRATRGTGRSTCKVTDVTIFFLLLTVFIRDKVSVWCLRKEAGHFISVNGKVERIIGKGVWMYVRMCVRIDMKMYTFMCTWAHLIFDWIYERLFRKSEDAVHIFVQAFSESKG